MQFDATELALILDTLKKRSAQARGMSANTSRSATVRENAKDLAGRLDAIAAKIERHKTPRSLARKAHRQELVEQTPAGTSPLEVIKGCRARTGLPMREFLDLVVADLKANEPAMLGSKLRATTAPKLVNFMAHGCGVTILNRAVVRVGVQHSQVHG